MTLLTPDSHPSDWYGWITNQSGHFMLGLVIAFLSKRIWPVIAVAVMAEVLQQSPDIIDSLTDIAFTLAGGVFYQFAGHAILWSAISAFIIGVYQRRK